MDEIYEELLNSNYLKYNDSVVVGVSGGPDSMCLLHILLRLRENLNLKIIVAHVNHNTGRPGQILDQEFVEEYCKNNNLIFEPVIIKDYGDDNFHNEARTFRYNYFHKLVKKYNAKYVFTAHHADDLMETILMRIVRGSTLKGYSGFSKIVKMDDYTIIRPLINVTKDKIYNYLESNNLKYRIDDSNLKDVYTRNRFRKYIVPQLKKEDPNVDEKFYKFSKTLIECNEYIDSQVKKIYNIVCPQNIINITEFQKQEHLIQVKLIYSILENYYQDDLMLLTDKHTELILNLINSNKSNCSIHLPNNIKGVKAYNSFYLTKIESKENKYEIQIEDYLKLPNGKSIEVIKSSEIDDNNICRLDSTNIKLPLYVRNKIEGDKMSVKGMIGSKKIKDIFIDSKVDLQERSLWPIVCDSNDNIVWLPGVKKSKFCKAKDEKYDIILKYY
jgi:tRNA(Ile)-lysidine synthase